MLTSIALEEAISLVTEDLEPLGSETVGLRAALGRTLAGPVSAPIDQPPFDRSPLDGYALRAADLADADRDHPALLSVVDTLYAGDFSKTPVGPGEAVRIMTGAMLPAGCDCVIRQEDTDQGEGRVAIYRSLNHHENYCFQGEDYRAGTPLLPQGARISAAGVGVLASAGLDTVSVHRRPSVCIISTGDEVVPPGLRPLPPGKIYASNGDLLLARLAELGIWDVHYELAADEPGTVAEAIRRGAGAYDFVLTTGGVSVGAKDILHEALPLAGAEPVFWKIQAKPGTPVLFSRLAGIPVLSLSGNPFAATVNFELLARPILAALSGEGDLVALPGRARMLTPFGKSGGYRRFLRGRCTDGGVALPEGHSAGQLCSLIGCNCLVDVPEGGGPLEPGDPVSILYLD